MNDLINALRSVTITDKNGLYCHQAANEMERLQKEHELALVTMGVIATERDTFQRQLSESYKALDAIDHITSSDFLEELGMRDESKMDADLKQCMEALSLIYKIAHSESPNHTCHAVHKDWRDLKSKVLETSEP